MLIIAQFLVHLVLVVILPKKMVGGFLTGRGRGVRRQHHVRCWASPEDVGKRIPVGNIDLTQVQ